MIEPTGALDLTVCDREPIHVPGSIQSHGFLLVCEPVTWRVTHRSENFQRLMPDASDALDQHLAEVIGKEAFHALTNALAASSSPGLPGRVFNLEILGGAYNAAIHDYAGRIVVELELLVTTYKDATPLFLVRSMLTRMQQAGSVEQVCNIAVEQLKVLIGFDRVIIYRFLHDGSGNVVAECREPDTASYLDHHYPASDIPQQARALYLKNWIRLIVDASSSPVPILAAAGGPGSAEVDLSYCGLRSVSPVHIEYLRNMGVAASMSISIIVGGTLWGLIACHHARPKNVPPDIRVAAEFFGQAFSLQMQSLERVDVAEMLSAARERLDRILTEIPPSTSLAVSIGPRLADLASFVPCDGAGLWANGGWMEWGTCPPIGEIPALAAMLNRVSHGAVFATDELPAQHAPARTYASLSSGLLAIPLSRTPGDYLMLFRQEFAHTISWAGNPNKPAGLGTQGERLTPRKSFELWQQEVRGRSRVWEPPDRLTAEALRISLLEVVLRYSELVAQERAKAERQQRMFAAELNHRVKNALALVGALVMQSKSKHRSLATFVADLEGRIKSLALAHDLAGATEPLELRHLLETELAPFANSVASRITLAGPHVALEEHASTVLALVMHELTTNAAKYGALSSDSGRLTVEWQFDSNGDCLIIWDERDGPIARSPMQAGLGTQLIRRQIPFELGGGAELSFTSSGVHAVFRIPAKSVQLARRTGDRDASIPALQSGRTASSPLTGLAVLIVEDNFIVALEAEQISRRIGAATVLVAGNLDEGSSYARLSPIDFAILDINLNGVTSYAIADVLLTRGIPFIFATGYGTNPLVPEKFAAQPVVAKPYSAASLAACASALLSIPPSH